ncbi:MAG: molybdopterin oxidoreductase, partial [Chloroflexi bacterium]|nr:molybdopterin oxidoreductase [Chloroflexota bacterium]
MTDSLDRHEQRRTAYLAALQACTDRVSRRRFLALSGASLALAGEAACAVPRDQIVPYVRPPQSLVPSEPLYFASADVLGGYAHGTLIETHTGRPTKVEGNLQHPASLGATDAFGQASVLNLYDPARSQAITENGQPSTWQVFSEELRRLLATLPSGGDGLRFLSGTITSPTFGAQMRQTLQRYPQARWHRWEPVGRDNARAGAQLAFGQVVEARYHFDAADVVVMLDADTLAWSPGRVRYQHDLALRRRPEHGALSRLYAVESTPSLFGAIADHRLPLPAHAIEAFAFALAGALGVNVGVAPPPPPAGVPSGWLE